VPKQAPFPAAARARRRPCARAQQKDLDFAQATSTSLRTAAMSTGFWWAQQPVLAQCRTFHEWAGVDD
jgi:hypothetical protein